MQVTEPPDTIKNRPKGGGRRRNMLTQPETTRYILTSSSIFKNLSLVGPTSSSPPPLWPSANR